MLTQYTPVFFLGVTVSTSKLGCFSILSLNCDECIINVEPFVCLHLLSSWKASEVLKRINVSARGYTFIAVVIYEFNIQLNSFFGRGNYENELRWFLLDLIWMFLSKWFARTHRCWNKCRCIYWTLLNRNIGCIKMTEAAVAACVFISPTRCMHAKSVQQDAIVMWWCEEQCVEWRCCLMMWGRICLLTRSRNCVRVWTIIIFVIVAILSSSVKTKRNFLWFGNS